MSGPNFHMDDNAAGNGSITNGNGAAPQPAPISPEAVQLTPLPAAASPAPAPAPQSTPAPQPVPVPVAAAAAPSSTGTPTNTAPQPTPATAAAPAAATTQPAPGSFVAVSIAADPKPSSSDGSAAPVEGKKETKDGKVVKKTEADKRREAALATDGIMWQKIELTEIAQQLKLPDGTFDFTELKKSPGLSEEEAAKRLQLFGLNRLTPPPQKPAIVKFLLKFTDPFMVLLILAGILSCIAYGLDTTIPLNLYIGIVLFVVTFLSCLFGFVQEGKSDSVMASFDKLLKAPKTSVRRGGREMQVDAVQVVPGDIVLLRSGFKVPADCRILYSNGLKVEQSSLTGEPEPIPCVDQYSPKFENPIEAHNLAMSSTGCVDGDGVGIVYKTGDQTFIGRIATLASVTKEVETTLQKEIKHVVHTIAKLGFTMACIFFIIGMARGGSFIPTFINGFVVVLIANVPEGLPMTVTSCLTITAKRMAEANVFIKRLQSVETLGSATTIASDKTGTLTMNVMTVANVWFDGQFKSAVEVGRNNGTLGGSTAQPSSTYRLLETIAGVNNTAYFEDEKDGTGASPAEKHEELHHTLTKKSTMAPEVLAHIQKKAEEQRLADEQKGKKSKAKNVVAKSATRSVVGDASDTALLRFVDSHSSIDLLRAKFEVGYEVKFNSRYKYAIKVVKALPEQKMSPELQRLSSALGGAGTGNTIRGATLRRGQGETLRRKKYVSAGDGTGVPTEAAAPLPTVGIAAPGFFDAPTATEGVVAAVQSAASPAPTPAGSAHIDIKQPVEASLTHGVPANPASVRIGRQGDYGVKDPERERLMLVKGAPEKILEKCTHYVKDGHRFLIDDEFRDAFDDAYERFGCEGERVLGFASKVLGPEYLDVKLDHESKEFPWGLDFVGLITLQDPPKPSVLPAIHECQEAGIRVMMVTGDHHLTAEAIARKVGIIHGHTRRSLARERDMEEKDVPEEDPLITAVVVQGKEIPAMSEERWDYILKHQEVVFARTSPQQKLEIVEHCQKRGEIVAVTGDGVNDSPALKQADIGVAMGINGSDVARGAAAVILLDDNFQSLVQGIKQGRTIFDNLTKTVAYTLAHLIPELLPVLLNLAFGLPLGMNSLLILCIDLGTEVMPAVSLAYEDSEGDVMRRKPRRAGIDKLVTKQTLFYSYLQAGAIECLAGFFAFFMVFYANGVPANELFFSTANYWDAPGQDDNKILPYTIRDGNTCNLYCQRQILGEAQSAYFMNLVMAQVFHIYLCKTRKVALIDQGIFKNFILNFGVVFSTLLMLFLVYVPFMNDILQSRYVHGWYWLIVPGSWICLFIVNEGQKYWTRHHPKSCVARYLAW